MPSKSDSILGHPWQTKFRGKLRIPEDIAERGWGYLPQEMREILTELYAKAGQKF